MHAVSIGELEARIVQAADGLKLLAYYGLVHWPRGPGQSDASFDGPNLTAKSRELLNACGVRTRVPAQLTNCCTLLAGAHGWNYGDGPELLAWVRNSVMRPVPRLPLTSDIMDEALELALKYVELAVLRFLDYDGPYLDRTALPPRRVWAGDFEPVPWAV